MTNRPILSAARIRKLELRWSALLYRYGLTGEHLHWNKEERVRLLRIASQLRTGRAHRTDQSEADEVGIKPSADVAVERYTDLMMEYWRIWRSSREGYEALVAWAEETNEQVCGEIASIWVVGSKRIQQWYRRVCGPVVREALMEKVKEDTTRARAMELDRLERYQSAIAPEPTSEKVVRPRTEERAKLVDHFIARCHQQGVKIRRKHIWRVAGYKQGRQFAYW